jgi:hypothetical protein
MRTGSFQHVRCQTVKTKKTNPRQFIRFPATAQSQQTELHLQASNTFWKCQAEQP